MLASPSEVVAMDSVGCRRTAPHKISSKRAIEELDISLIAQQKIWRESKA